MSGTKTTIYLADDHQIVIDGLKLLIDGEPELQIVGSATNGQTAYDELLSKRPKIALIDHRMPGMNGLDLVKSLKKQISTSFIILSMHDERQLITDAMNYGASGYLLKNTGKAELLNCINKVAAGESYFSPAVTSKAQQAPARFTPRELEIMRMVVSEQTTQQISKELYLSTYTVETHRKNICKKTNTKTVIGLVNYIREHNIEL